MNLVELAIAIIIILLLLAFLVSNITGVGYIETVFAIAESAILLAAKAL